MSTLPITANYRRDGDDWTVTVHAGAEEREATAPGLIAVRLAADELVEDIADGREDLAVVHLLDGDAFTFSVAYLHTRAGLTLPQTGDPEASTTHDQVVGG